MTKFNTIISKLPALPAVVGRYDVDFIETADKFLNDLPPFAQVYNTTITEINNAGLTIQKIGEETESLRNETLNYKNSTYAYREEAVNAANFIKSYVIPKEATYSKDTIDNNHNSLLTALTATQAQVSMLNKFQSDLIKNVTYKNDFENRLKERGYQKLPGGLIIQWGIDKAGGIIKLPIKFPNLFLGCSAVNSNAEDSVATPVILIQDTTSFLLKANSGDVSYEDWVHWIAIGF